MGPMNWANPYMLLGLAYLSFKLDPPLTPGGGEVQGLRPRV